MYKNRILWLVIKLAFGCFLLVLLPQEVSARTHPRGYCELVPETWTPSLEQVKDYLDEASKAQPEAPQQALNQMSQNLADISDTRLFITYIQLMQKLDIQGQAKLFEEQKRWLGKRAESAQAAVISTGGSLAPLEYSGAFKKITEERLAELQKRLQQPRNINHSKK
jgi:uncharacterized protein YecT (DUF1311 family)